MDRFVTIVAIILAIPTTLYVLWLWLAVFMTVIVNKSRIVIKLEALIPIILFALCWAWILH